MIIWVVRYYDVDDIISKDKPPMVTEFYRSVKEVMKRKGFLEQMVVRFPDSIYFTAEDDIKMIEYSRADELIVQLNLLNTEKFNK